MEITASSVKELRTATGAGMMDCKKALGEADGDMARAVDILRTKGLADLAKKAGRATNEGLIGAFVTDSAHIGSLIEVNCETDFVARNEDFKSFVAALAEHIAIEHPDDVATLMAQPYHDDPSLAVEQFFGEKVAKIGENMTLPRFVRFEVGSESGTITAYIHGVGNIGVLVECSAGSADAAASDAFRAFGKNVAMQIAATAPVAVTRDEVAAETVAHETGIYKAQAAESGKPEAIQAKIAEGRLEKFYKEVCLMEQAFVKDPDMSVTQLAKKVSSEAGAEVGVVRFARWALGETGTGEDAPAC
ncbi:MAG: elongation factor Ts [Coriobacteriaceae bacterium]|nr:elongation factor Ts [Coriobacteriaceae bacterium]